MAKSKKETAEKTILSGSAVTNGAELHLEMPYYATVKLKGTSPMLFHRWDCNDVDEKANAPKGSKAKKTDNLEAYVWRNEDGDLCLPLEYVRMAMVKASKYFQDPASSRKSAHDLVKASIIPMGELASLGTKDWDKIDRRRVVVNRAGVNRERPCMNAGWECEMTFMVQAPDLIPPQREAGTKLPDFRSILDRAGMFEGVGDFRPTFGRFQVNHFEVAKAS